MCLVLPADPARTRRAGNGFHQSMRTTRECFLGHSSETKTTTGDLFDRARTCVITALCFAQGLSATPSPLCLVLDVTAKPSFQAESSNSRSVLVSGVEDGCRFRLRSFASYLCSLSSVPSDGVPSGSLTSKMRFPSTNFSLLSQNKESSLVGARTLCLGYRTRHFNQLPRYEGMGVVGRDEGIPLDYCVYVKPLFGRIGGACEHFYLLLTESRCLDAENALFVSASQPLTYGRRTIFFQIIISYVSSRTGGTIFRRTRHSGLEERKSKGTGYGGC